MALNPEQIKAVESTTGHICVNAGAGSGKTRVLIQRIGHLLKNGVKPSEILAFTFTKKAAGEMQDRLAEAGFNGWNEVACGTMHSIYWNIMQEHLPDLKPDCYRQGMNIIRQWQQKKLFGEIHKEMHFSNPEIHDENECRKQISLAKNMGLSPIQYEEYMVENEFPPFQVEYFATVYDEYEQRKLQSGWVDFDDMLIQTRDMFQEFPDVLLRYQEQWQYVSIDEFQDINVVQQQLAEMLIAKHGNLFVVGDARQSVYGFRGSEPKFIMDFSKRYPDATVISLPRNYRCGSTILSAANALIAHNPEGLEPMICETGTEGQISASPPHSSKEEEGEAIVAQIQREVTQPDSERNYGDMAILYRCNYQSRPIEDALIGQSIPYEIVGGFGFYGRREIQDIVAYMEVVVRGEEQEHDEFFHRIYNRPTRYIGKKFLQEWEVAKDTGAIECLQKWGWEYPAVTRRSVGNVKLLGKDLQRLKKDHWDSPSGFIRYIRENMGYDDWFLDDVGEEANVDQEEVLGNLNELLASAENFRNIEKMLNYIRDAIRKTKKAEDSRNKVMLMTMHRAKGLEFPLVFLAGIHSDLVPHSKSSNRNEERRLLYVGVTRAKEDCRLSYYHNHQNREVGASPFFGEMEMTVEDPPQEFLDRMVEVDS